LIVSLNGLCVQVEETPQQKPYAVVAGLLFRNIKDSFDILLG